ncbi:hypothetical protein BJ138DRAFT_1021161 [Hygrophoropsis aurantiaca]|uniref:Uncharacterized protein n=1 Tax=Hygrophoropsis aurantiaca TaxID=72124 RepID=A0ACB7ZQB0_9AGAM|nr:hypothetical protein BJ138DRAFT_1021161 [Hygrophoropsis aurantiaca]
MQLVEDFEAQLHVESRWGPTHPERIKAQARINHRLFYKAADDVERLVVMRLLEMTKLQMSGLGYKLRTHIAKALKTRAIAIRNALDRYNKHGAAIEPPVEPLKWEQVVEYTFLAEFDLLRHSDGRLHEKRWAKPKNREASMRYYDLQRSKEEIKRCNVEILRLLTKIRDDEIDIPRAITELDTSCPALATQLRARWKYLRAVNAIHIARIRQIQALPGYTGPMEPGTRVGREPKTSGSCPLRELVDQSGGDDAGLDQDQSAHDEEGLGDLFANAHISDNYSRTFLYLVSSLKSLI